MCEANYQELNELTSKYLLRFMPYTVDNTLLSCNFDNVVINRQNVSELMKIGDVPHH